MFLTFLGPPTHLFDNVILKWSLICGLIIGWSKLTISQYFCSIIVSELCFLDISLNHSDCALIKQAQQLYLLKMIVQGKKCPGTISVKFHFKKNFLKLVLWLPMTIRKVKQPI